MFAVKCFPVPLLADARVERKRPSVHSTACFLPWDLGFVLVTSCLQSRTSSVPDLQQLLYRQLSCFSAAESQMEVFSDAMEAELQTSKPHCETLQWDRGLVQSSPSLLILVFTAACRLMLILGVS